MKRPETTRAAETRLIANLREQHDLHERLLGELKSKREAIRTADMQRVFEVSQREQRIVLRMTTLEQNRQEAILQIIPANVRQNGTQPTLSDVLPHVSPSARQEIEALQVSLRDRVTKVSELSSVIRAAGEALHQHITGVVQSMQRVFSEAGVYERRGVVAGGQRLASTIDVRS